MSDTHILYFAYGSNMYTPRLRFRVPGAEVVGLGHLHAHRLRFHKRSNDSSGKCNAEPSTALDDVVTGVLFRIPRNQLSDLHRAEGRGGGYDDVEVRVLDYADQWKDAITYRARSSHIDEGLHPFTWYWDFVASGAREHALPAEYVERCISNVEHHADPNKARDRDERLKVLGGPRNGGP